jgi:hypothetical protein
VIGYHDDALYERERIPQIQLSGKRVTARKQHRCSGCLAVIEPGQRYIREFWLIDSEPTTVTRHGGCDYY